MSSDGRPLAGNGLRALFHTAEFAMIIESTNYYAKNGNLDAVIAQRQKASQIRLALGLPAGKILVRVDGDGPDVRWECEFETQEAYDHDRQVRQTSQEFAVVRDGMHALLERFERHVQRPL